MLTHTHDLEQLRPDLLPVTSGSSSDGNVCVTTVTATTGPTYFDGANFVSLPSTQEEQAKSSSRSTAITCDQKHTSESKLMKQKGGWHFFFSLTGIGDGSSFLLCLESLLSLLFDINYGCFVFNGYHMVALALYFLVSR